MEFKNLTRFPALAFAGLTPDGEAFHTVVLRQTLSYASGTLAFTEEQTPLVTVDTVTGETNQSSILAESDLCHYKPQCDFLVNATAHAPMGRPARSFPVRLTVFAPKEPGSSKWPVLLDKRLLVSGPSSFRKRNFLFRCLWFLVKAGSLGLIRRNPWKRTRPEWIQRLPIRYESAFGGQAKILIADPRASRVKKRNWLPGVTFKALNEAWKSTGQSEPLAWTAHDANPIGQGFAEAWHLKATKAKAIPAPQIEAPEAPVTAHRFWRWLRGKDKDDPAFIPQGFGALAKGWAPRCGLVGTVDDAWIQSGDHLPDDFDFAVWNAAPADQRLPAIMGDERIVLTNLCTPKSPCTEMDQQGNTVLRLDLPGHMPYVLVRHRSGEMVPTPMVLDTLTLDPEQQSLVLVWRMILPFEPLVRVLEARMIQKEDKGEWLRRGGPKLAAMTPTQEGSHV